MIPKIIKVETTLLKLNLMKLATYRADMFLGFMGGLMYNIGGLLFIEFLFRNIPSVAGWDKWDLVSMYGMGQFFAYFYFFFSYPNLKKFNRFIKNGELDQFLLKPVNSLILSTLREFDPVSLLALVQPVAMLYYTFSNKLYHITVFSVLLSIFSLMLTIVTIHLLFVLTCTISFWFIDTDFSHFVSDTSDISRYPYEIFENKYVRFFFFFVLPYGLAINVPFRALIGRLDYRLFFVQIFVCGLFIFLSNWVWKRGLRAYQSASS